MFYRKNPDNGGFVIFAGLEQFVKYVQDLSFTDDDIEYLRSLNTFDEDFLDDADFFLLAIDNFLLSIIFLN